MNAKDIENKVKALYENVEPGHLEQSDYKILRYELQGLKWKERFADESYKRKYGEKISKNKNKVSPELAFILWDRIHERGNKNSRTTKNFKALAKEYNLSLTYIYDIANGQHYAFGGEIIYKDSTRGIRINQTKINVEKERKEWYRSWFGILEFVSPDGIVYSGFENYIDASNFMHKQLGTKHNPNVAPEVKSFKKFGHLEIGEEIIGKQKFWKGWTFKRVP